jgi:beta-glucosidase
VPIYLTENGTPSGREVPDENCVVHDSFRIEYVQNILKQLHKTMAEGIDVRGYFLWSLLDNFEWCAGYEPRYGIVRTDYDTQKRTVKDSGRWYSRMIADNGFSVD